MGAAVCAAANAVAGAAESLELLDELLGHCWWPGRLLLEIQRGATELDALITGLPCGRSSRFLDERYIRRSGETCLSVVLRQLGAVVLALPNKEATEPSTLIHADLRAMPALREEAVPYPLHQAPMAIPLQAIKYIACFI